MPVRTRLLFQSTIGWRLCTQLLRRGVSARSPSSIALLDSVFIPDIFLLTVLVLLPLLGIRHAHPTHPYALDGALAAHEKMPPIQRNDAAQHHALCMKVIRGCFEPFIAHMRPNALE
jgi:hypothetical protein